MKNYLLFALCILSATISFSQPTHGLKNIIVEKYYIADSIDAANDKFGLEKGAITYRIFVEMLPSYKLQAVYGLPGHELKISTTTNFYNNLEFGASIANEVLNENLKKSTTMLDSWISVAAGGEDCFAVLKSADDEKTVVYNINNPQLLQSENPLAGIPIKKRDGLKHMALQSVVAKFGIDSILTLCFNTNNSGKKNMEFKTTNGSWGSFGGSIGQTPPDNQVCIAQITTTGDLSFELNLQIGAPDGTIQRYVARNPKESEISLPCLIYPQKLNSNKSMKKNIPKK